MQTLRRRSLAVLVVAVATRTGQTVALGDDLKPTITVRSVNGVCSLVLEAAVRDNPFPAAGDNNTLRSPVYILREANGQKQEDSSLVGPVIRVRKGDVLRIRVDNRLDPALLPAELPDPAPNFPHGYATTNLHTHGMHVSPAGRGDNVYVEIEPHENHQFEYQILPNHPGGTFWYHPHKHGSVALQLTGGMAGALIVEGDNDGIPEIDQTTEQVFVLQQFHGSLDCADPTNTRLVAQPKDIYDRLKEALPEAAPQARVPTWRAEKAMRKLRAKAKRLGNAEGKTAAEGKEKADAAVTAKAAPSTCDTPVQDNLNNDNEWLLVNGQYRPTFQMRPGEVQRWRFIHAGLDEVINVAVVEKTDKGECYHKLHEIAVDGILRGRKIERTSYLMYPAYRWDVLFKAPSVEPGKTRTLCLVDDHTEAGDTLSSFETDRNLIATIEVSGDPKDMQLPCDDALAKAVPPDFRDTISDREVGNRRWSLTFDFPDRSGAEVSQFPINGFEFSRRVDRCVWLNTAEEWRIESRTGTSNAAGHPFHVHVNPFQHFVYEEIYSLNFNGLASDTMPTGATLVTALAFGDPFSFKVGDTISFTGHVWTGASFTSVIPVTADLSLDQVATALEVKLNEALPCSYQVAVDHQDLAKTKKTMVIRALKGQRDDLTIVYSAKPAESGQDVDLSHLSFTHDRLLVDLIWRDTLLAPQGRTEMVRMRFRDWPGDTVLHCHIVDHEDQGMMKNIRILGPGEEAPRDQLVPGPSGKSRSRRRAAAPHFSLPDARGRRHALDEFAGRPVILLFVRGPACFKCMKQLQAYSEIADRLSREGIALVAISSTTRGSLDAAEETMATNDECPFLLLSDTGLNVFERFGCVSKNTEPLHGTFVVDPEGSIVLQAVGDKPEMSVTTVVEQAARSRNAIRAPVEIHRPE